MYRLHMILNFNENGWPAEVITSPIYLLDSHSALWHFCKKVC